MKSKTFRKAAAILLVLWAPLVGEAGDLRIDPNRAVYTRPAPAGGTVLCAFPKKGGAAVAVNKKRRKYFRVYQAKLAALIAKRRSASGAAKKRLIRSIGKTKAKRTKLDAICRQSEPIGRSSSVSQYGITWTFDKSYRVGRFVNGDWWVMPDEAGRTVTVESVTVTVDGALQPAPRYNAGNKLLHGSMLNPMGSTGQAYDERAQMWNKDLVVSFPAPLSPLDSLMTAVSRPDGDSKRLDVMGADVPLTSVYLLTMGVLTCMPADSTGLETKFRPPYSYPRGGTTADKPASYDAANLNWSLLPSITPLPGWPGNNTTHARRFQRVCPMHVDGASASHIRPLDNTTNYYRSQYHIEGEASLMMLFNPAVVGDSRTELVQYFIQYGIDSIYCLRSYDPDGVRPDRQITSWPAIFASLMLGDGDLRKFPPAGASIKDRQMYYATHWAGGASHPDFAIDDNRRKFRQVVWDDRNGGSHEIHDPCTWHTLDFNGSDGWKLDAYRRYSWMYTGTALAARLMNALGAWNQPAFFDYVDRWMMDVEPNDYWEYFLQCYRNSHSGQEWNGYTQGDHPWSAWVRDMWLEYR